MIYRLNRRDGRATNSQIEQRRANVPQFQSLCDFLWMPVIVLAGERRQAEPESAVLVFPAPKWGHGPLHPACAFCFMNTCNNAIKVFSIRHQAGQRFFLAVNPGQESAV